MRHNLLRRLGALALTLALTLSLSVTPAWAAPTDSQWVTVGDQEVRLKLVPDSGSIIDDLGDLLLAYDETTKGSTGLTAVLENKDGNAPNINFRVEWKLEGTAATKTEDPTNDKVCEIESRMEGDVTVAATATLVDANGDALEDTSGNLLPELTAQYTVHVFKARLRLRFQGENADMPSAFSMKQDEEKVVEATVMRGDTGIINGLNMTWDVERQTGTGPAGEIVEVTHSNNTLKITAKGPGTVKITARSNTYGVESSFMVQVEDSKAVAVRDITLSGLDATMTVGDIKPITVTVLPANATNKDITWSWTKDDKGQDVVTVETDDKGVHRVRAHRVGTATITARSVSNPSVSSEFKITVVTELVGIKIAGVSSDGRLPLGNGVSKPGDRQVIHAEPSPRNAVVTASGVEWKSDNTDVVTVAKNSTPTSGLYATLTLVNPGKANITVKVGKAEDSCVYIVPGVVLKSSGVNPMTGGKLSMKVGETEQLGWDAYGRAEGETGTSAPLWWSSDSSIVEVDRNTGKITARKPGSAVISLQLGNYDAECTVTVAEDTSAVIQAGNINAGSTFQMSSISGKLSSVCQAKTGAGLSYITNLSVPTAQGILHNNHRSEADTGAGVGADEKYYPGKSSGPDALSALSFVPRSTFSGTAEITYTGWATNGKSYNGVIRMTVSGLGEKSDVAYSTNGDPVTFQTDDFNIVSNAKTGHNLKYVTFTPPESSKGTLYYNYVSDRQPGEKVTAGTQYKRSGTPNLERVTFVPAAGFAGTVKISYRGTDTSGNSYTGTVTITVGQEDKPADPADIYYFAEEQSWVTFRANDFATASRRVIGEELSYVRFTQPDSSEGTLFYNYQGFAENSGMVKPDTNYYRSGTPSAGNVSFVPTTTSPGQVEITYTGYGVRGTAFTGTIHVSLYDGTQPGGIRYTVVPGRNVYFSAGDFYSACRNATGKQLYYVRFTSLPAVGAGTLRYLTRNGSTSYTVSTGTACYYNNSYSVQLSNVFFQANANYNGVVSIPFTGCCTDNTTFEGEVVIYVTTSTTNPVNPNPTPGSSYFADMYGYSWAVQAVDYLYANEVVNGTGNGNFSPGQKILRRDFVVMLCRAFGFTSSSTRSFSDVPSNTYYSRAIAAARELGVVSGDGSRFYPNNQLTREDAMVMIYNALEAAGRGVGNVSTSVLKPFQDAGSISNYAREAVATLVKQGVIGGDNHGRLNPRNTITRAEVSVILYRILTL